jgi:hypothetical protein
MNTCIHRQVLNGSCVITHEPQRGPPEQISQQLRELFTVSYRTRKATVDDGGKNVSKTKALI